MFLFNILHATNRLKKQKQLVSSTEQTIQQQCHKHFSKLRSSEMAIYNYLVLFKENRKLKDIHVKEVIHKCLPPKLLSSSYPVFYKLKNF